MLRVVIDGYFAVGPDRDPIELAVQYRPQVVRCNDDPGRDSTVLVGCSVNFVLVQDICRIVLIGQHLLPVPGEFLIVS